MNKRAPASSTVVSAEIDAYDVIDHLYADRNRAVQLAASLARRLGYNAGVRLDRDTQDPAWPVVFIDLPGGRQVSWHVAAAELDPSLPTYHGAWDEHDDTTKHRRIAAYLADRPITVTPPHSREDLRAQITTIIDAVVMANYADSEHAMNDLFALADLWRAEGVHRHSAERRTARAAKTLSLQPPTD